MAATAAIVAWAFAAALLPPTAAGAEAGIPLAERFEGLIESLDAPSQRRARVLETIYSELRGPHGRELQELLRESLTRGNTFILAGVVEAMAMLGDPRDVANLDALLATSSRLEVKTLVIRLLPAFCLPAERARFNYIAYAAGHERVARPGVLEPLRRPPITRRGRLDVSLERLQGRVIRSLAAQFDPVAAALGYANDMLYGAAARQTVVHYAGDALGNDPERWTGIWASQGDDMALQSAGEIEEIRMAALVSLADMGAEGLPEVIAAFRIVESSDDGVSRQGAFDAMAIMCRAGFQTNQALAAMDFAAEDEATAESWRRRRYASNANLAVFAAGSATKTLSEGGDAAVFASAAACLGAALSYPAGFPDPDGAMAAARAKGLRLLERLLLMPDISREKRAAVALALGDIGAAHSVAAVAGIIDSPYCSPEFGEDGARMAEAAIDALRDIATGAHEGRDEARRVLVGLLRDGRMYPPLRADALPVGLAHMVLWRLQRLARSTDISLEPEVWKARLGW